MSVELVHPLISNFNEQVPTRVDSFWNRFFRFDFKCLGRENLFASRWQGRISCVCEGNWLLILDFPGIDAPQIQDSSCVCVWGCLASWFGLSLHLPPVSISQSEEPTSATSTENTRGIYVFTLGFWLSLGMVFVNTLPRDDICQYTPLRCYSSIHSLG